MAKKLVSPLVLLGLVILYLPSFTARFFQDDFLLLELAKQGDWFTPVAGFPYRPLSIHVFYGLGLLFFGSNPLGFHLLLFLIFLISLYFLRQISRLLLGSDDANTVVIIYAYNISLFPLFYWIATSYITLAVFSVLGGLFFYLRGRRFDAIITVGLFILGLLSNELMVVFPALLLAVDWYLKRFHWQRTLLYASISLAYFCIRVALAVLPRGEAYTLNFTAPTFLATFRWYFLRVFNLPEGVKIAAGPEIYLLFGVVTAMIIWQVVRQIRQGTFPYRLGLFSLWWFLAGALPFYFLPNHMSSYYLSIALLGPSIFLGKLLSGSKLIWIFVFSYLLLAIAGLNYLSETHWIILKWSK